LIKIKKGEMPQILKDNSAAWTATFLSKISSGEKPSDSEATKYRHPQVKAALLIETNGKCAYCESKLLHIHHGDVEHIFPKSLSPSLRFDWNNLTIACEVCNQKKSDLDPQAEFIIDPYNIDPKDHLRFFGAVISSLGTAYGKNTTSLLALNRAELVERRKEKLDGVLSICETILCEDLPLVTRRALLADLIAHEASSQSSYTAMVRAAIAALQDKFVSLQ
jgi:uncharacterized protein (TIGR02646 family)